MSIKKGKTTFDGVIEIDGKLACEKCKTINPKAKTIMHMDYTDKFVYQYECDCGNAISTSTKRDKKSAAMWG